MRNSIMVFAVIGSMAGMLLTGCGKTTEQKLDKAKEGVGDATQELKNARAEYLAEWENFKRESEAAIEANAKRIDAFKAKMDTATPAVKAKYDKQVAVLEQRNRDLKKKLDDYKDEGQGKWEEFRTNFKRDMDDLGKTMTDLFKDIG